MALERITNPPVLDTTGQNIVSKLDQIKNAVQPINPCLDIDISIPANGWSSSSPYTYTYSNNHISSGCSVKVDFLEGAQSTKILYLEFEKVVNGVRFTSATKPTTAIPVRLHILNADATSAMATTADEVSTNAVPGSANVEDALGSLSEQIVPSQSILQVQNNEEFTSGQIKFRKVCGNMYHILINEAQFAHTNSFETIGYTPNNISFYDCDILLTGGGNTNTVLGHIMISDSYMYYNVSSTAKLNGVGYAVQK